MAMKLHFENPYTDDRLDYQRAAIESALVARGLTLADVDDWAEVAKDAWDAALADALGVPAPQESGPPSFKEKRTP